VVRKTSRWLFTAPAKTLKKLRGVLRLVGGELGKKCLQGGGPALPDAGRLLSGSRDAEVKLEDAAGAAPPSRGPSGGARRALAGHAQRPSGDELAAALRGESEVADRAGDRDDRGRPRRNRPLVAGTRLLGTGGSGPGEELPRRATGR